MTDEPAKTILGLPIALVGVLVGGAITLLGSIFVQLLSNKKSLRRERMAELRKVLAEFAASGFTLLTLRDRLDVHTQKYEEIEQEVRAGKVPANLSEAMSDLGERTEDEYFRTLDRFVEARCRVLLLEVDADRRKEMESLFGRVVLNKSAIPKDALGTDHREEAERLRVELTAWIQLQAKRTDI